MYLLSIESWWLMNKYVYIRSRRLGIVWQDHSSLIAYKPGLYYKPRVLGRFVLIEVGACIRSFTGIRQRKQANWKRKHKAVVARQTQNIVFFFNVLRLRLLDRWRQRNVFFLSKPNYQRSAAAAAASAPCLCLYWDANDEKCRRRVAVWRTDDNDVIILDWWATHTCDTSGDGKRYQRKTALIVLSSLQLGDDARPEDREWV